MMEGLAFAQEIGLPLNTHLIVHWGGTLLGDELTETCSRIFAICSISGFVANSGSR